MFEMEVEAKIVPLTQLYGGKIAAALSRQHPRDIFDISHMNISFDEAKYGFIFCLLGSDRPIYESFAPSLIDQKETMEKQFAGMSDLYFTYDDYEETRNKLILNVRNILTEEDKRFLVSFEQENPNWEESAYGDFANYPSVKWKLLTYIIHTFVHNVSFIQSDFRITSSLIWLCNFSEESIPNKPC
jgi:hypothetical protein